MAKIQVEKTYVKKLGFSKKIVQFVFHQESDLKQFMRRLQKDNIDWVENKPHWPDGYEIIKQSPSPQYIVRLTDESYNQLCVQEHIDSIHKLGGYWVNNKDTKNQEAHFSSEADATTFKNNQHGVVLKRKGSDFRLEYSREQYEDFIQNADNFDKFKNSQAVQEMERRSQLVEDQAQRIMQALYTMLPKDQKSRTYSPVSTRCKTLITSDKPSTVQLHALLGSAKMYMKNSPYLKHNDLAGSIENILAMEFDKIASKKLDPAFVITLLFLNELLEHFMTNALEQAGLKNLRSRHLFLLERMDFIRPEVLEVLESRHLAGLQIMDARDPSLLGQLRVDHLHLLEKIPAWDLDTLKEKIDARGHVAPLDLGVLLNKSVAAMKEITLEYVVFRKLNAVEGVCSGNIEFDSLKSDLQPIDVALLKQCQSADYSIFNKLNDIDLAVLDKRKVSDLSVLKNLDPLDLEMMEKLVKDSRFLKLKTLRNDILGNIPADQAEALVEKAKTRTNVRCALKGIQCEPPVQKDPVVITVSASAFFQPVKTEESEPVQTSNVIKN